MSQRYEQRQEERDQDGAVVEELRWPGKRTRVGAAMAGAPEGAASAESDPRRPDIARIRAAVGGLSSGGEKLDPNLAAKFGGQLGVDLSSVTLHKDNAGAADLGASAFAHGDHVALAPGLDLNSPGGQHVLAHELVHVAQNKAEGGSAMEFAARMDVGPSSSPAESQAEAGASALLSGQSFSAGGVGTLPGISMFEGPPPAAPAATPTPAPAEQIPATDPRSPDYDPSKDPAVLAQLAQVPTVNTTTQAPAPPVPQPKPAPAPPPTPAAKPPATTPTAAPASKPRPSIGPAPAPSAPKAAPTANLDELVRQKLEERADPAAKQSYSNATNQIDILRIQAVQYAFQPTGLGSNILASLWPWEAWKQHGREISLTNPYDTGSLQAWIEGARATIRILGDVAAWVATIADIVAAVSGLLAIISSWTGAGLVIFGAIAAIAAEVGTIAGLIKIILDIIDVVIGVVQMILTIKKIKASKDPAERAKLGALLGREVKEVSGAVVGIGVQVVTIVATAGLAAGVSGAINKTTKGFWKNFGKQLAAEFRPILAPKQSIQVIREAAALGVRAPKQAIRDNVDPKTITQKEIADGAVTVERIETRKQIVKSNLSRKKRKARGKLRETREVVTKRVLPVESSKDLRVPRSDPGKRGVQRQSRFIVDPNKLKTGIPKAEIEGFSIDASAIIPGQTAGQVQARAKKTGDASAPPERTAQLPGTQGPIGTSPITQVAMWPSQLDKLKETKAGLPPANDRLMTMYNLAKGQAGEYQSGQLEKVFAGVKNAAGQMRLGALQQQQEAGEGATQSEKGATTAAQGKQSTTALSGKTAAMDASTQKMGAQKVEKPPPKEGGSWWDKAKNWLYNQTIGRIGDALGGLQGWLTKSIGGWVMAQSGLTKEELDMAGIENGMRADHQKDKQTEAEMKAAQDEANKIDPKLAEIMKGANADEQAALQAMMESQEFMTSIDDAQKALDEAIAAGTTYIGEVSPIIRHEMETQTGGKAIDEAYVAPVIGGANAVKGAVGGGEELAQPAADEVIAELMEAQVWWPELNLAPSLAGVDEAKQAFVTSHAELSNKVKGAADGVIAKVSGLVGSQDYAGVTAAAHELDGALDRYSADEDRLADVYLRNLEAVIDATAALIQSAVVMQEVDVPVDEEPAPVQRKADGGARNDNADPGVVAAAGTKGPGGKLPHYDRIQASFGKHDVSGIQAHVGGDAADAAGNLGAKAFATGNKVAFGAEPDLHTAAHEAAHVVQQRSGVSLKAIDGGASDPHEQHADRVADAVVAGQSAEALLDKPGSTAAPKASEPAALAPAESKPAAKADAPVGKSVQRKQADAPQPPPGADADREEKKDKADISAIDKQASGAEPALADETKQPPKAGDGKLDIKKDAKEKPGAAAKAPPKKDAAPAVDPKTKGADGGDAGQPPVAAPKPPAGVVPATPADVVAPMPVAPVPRLQLADIASNPKQDKKWIDETGRAPAAHHTQIQGELDALSAEIQAKQNELMSLADAEATRIGNEIAGKVASFTSAVVAPGRARIDVAFGGMTTSIDAAEQKSKADIAAAKVQGTAQIATSKAQKAGELGKKFTDAKVNNEALLKKNIPIAVASIQRFTATLPPFVTKAKQQATTVTGGIAAQKEFDPTQFRGQWGKIDQGVAAVKADVGKNLLIQRGQSLGKNYEAAINAFGQDMDKRAGSIIQESLEPAKKELDFAVDMVETTTKKSLDAAEVTAKAQLATTEQAALKQVADSKAASLSKWSTEKAASIAEADKAGKALADNTSAAATELTSRIKKRASEDAANYGALAADVQSGLRGGKPQKYEDVAPQIADAKQRLAAGHAENMAGLRALVSSGGNELGSTLTKQQGLYDAAIKAQEDRAKVVEQTLTKDIGASATAMSGSLGGLSKGFDEAATKQNAAIDTAVGEFKTAADGAFNGFDKKVTDKLSAAVAQLDGDLTKALDAKTLKDEALHAGQKEIKAKEKAAIAGSGALRKAMDGWGTDENAIYETLRKCSYGEIELLEATYDSHYDNRGKDGKSPLRYDLWDEMSKGELAIAMAYLTHDRQTALKLEIDDSKGWLWNDNKRIESVLRSASDDELKGLQADPASRLTLDTLKNSFWTSDKDTFTALLDTSMSREDRHTKANAVRLFHAMDGWGTDEAKVKQLLLEAATPEERKRLRAQFNAYAAAKKSSWATDKKDRREADDREEVLGPDGKPTGQMKGDVDALDRALTDDFGSGEVHYVRELAKEERNETAVAMGKAVEAADGMGTDEDSLFDALEDKEYAEAYKKLKDSNDPKKAEKLREMEAARKAKLDKLLGRMGHKKGVENLLREELDQPQLFTGFDKQGQAQFVAITYEELEAGKRKDGTAITAADKQRLRNGVGLEGMVGQRKLQTGTAEPELLLAYACWGVVGTHEELVNKALSNGEEPKPIGELRALNDNFRRIWGVPLVDKFEIDNPQPDVEESKMRFDDPGGLLSAELGGKDWLKTRVLLCGKPTTAAALRYVQKLQIHYAKSGVLSGALMWVGEATGYTEAGSTLDHSNKKFDDKYAQIRAQVAASGGDITKVQLGDIKGKRDDKGNLLEGQVDGSELELLGEFLQQDAEAYAAALSSIVDTIVTVLEIVGAVIITVVTAGTASPVLAAVIANLVLSAGTIAFKYAALGDQYGAGDLAKDVAAAAITAGFAGLGEVRSFATWTQKVGAKATGSLFRVTEEAAAKAGVEAMGKGAFSISAKGFDTISKVVAEGTKNLIISTGQELATALTDEKTYEMKLGEALWGENSIAVRLIKSAPRAFAEGGMRQLLNGVTGVSSQNQRVGIRSPVGNALATMVSEAGANVAGFFLYLDNYDDAQHFWDNLLKTTGQKAAGGLLQGYGMHKARAKNLARDMVKGWETPEQMDDHLHYLDPKEVAEVAKYLKQYAPDQLARLSEPYRKAGGMTDPAPTQAADPATTPVVRPPAPPDGDPATQPKKADTPSDATADAGDAASQAKTDTEAAAAAKQKAIADATERQRLADAEAAKAQKPAEQPKPADPAADPAAAVKPKPDEQTPAVKPVDDKPPVVVKPDDKTPATKPVLADEPVHVPTPAEEDHARPTAGSHKGKDVFTPVADGTAPAKTSPKQLHTALESVASGRTVVVHTEGSIEITVMTPNGPIKVPAKVSVTDALPPSSHGDDGGAARFTLDHVDGKWVATISVKQGLHPDDIRFVVGHEVDEISALVGKHPAGKPAGGLQEQTQAGVLGGGKDKATAHDQAGAREIVDLFNDYKRLLAEGSPEAARRKATLDRALEAQGLTDAQHIEAKRNLLKDAGATEELLNEVSTKARPVTKPVDTDGTDGATPKPVDNTPSAETLELAKKAFEVYAGEIDGAKDILKQIGGAFGEVEGRPKDPESAANRLQRAINNKWAKDGIHSVHDAVDNTWDALGTRLVVNNVKDMPEIVKSLKAAIESGQIEVTAINNLHAATDGKPYMTAAEITSIAASANEMAKPGADGKKQQIKTDVGKPMDGGFTGVMIYVKYPSGVRGEIQIIGKQALAVAAIEHIPYDIGLGKPIVRNVHPDIKPQMDAVLGPVEEAVRRVNADPVQKAAYEKYLASLYKHARDIENGIDSPPPKLPDGIDQHLSMEGLQRVHHDLEELKKQSKALKEADAKKPVTGSAKGAHVYDTADAVPTLKIDAAGAKELVELHNQIKALDPKDPQHAIKKQELARRLGELHGDNLEAHRKLLADAGAPDDMLEQLKTPVKPGEVAKAKPVGTNEAETDSGDATTKPSVIKPPVTEADAKNAAALGDSVDGLRKTFADELATKNTKLVPPPSDKPVLMQGAGDALIGLPIDTIPPTSDAASAMAILQKKGIPRWGALTENERAHETAFANAIEADLPSIVERFYASSKKADGSHTFEVDGAKKMYAAYGAGAAPDGADQLHVRATANHALHPTAVAIARVAFLQHLDAMASLPADHPQRAILVTNGGCAAGKGSLTDIVKGNAGGKFKFGGVWDSAGEGDASENMWILKAAQARGLKVTFGFVESDPNVTYGGVLDRAEASGRIVDPVTFTRSYVKGQENMRAFLDSPEYKAALANGEVETAGVYTGKFDKDTKSFPQKRLLGDNGKIGADDLATPPSETEISKRAVEIFEAWLKKQQAAGKPIDHWVEGGIVNPLKFDPNAGAAGDGTAKPRVDAPDVKPAPKDGDAVIPADDPVLKKPVVAAAEPDQAAPAKKQPGTDEPIVGAHKGKDTFPTTNKTPYSPDQLVKHLTAGRDDVTLGEITATQVKLTLKVRDPNSDNTVDVHVTVNIADTLSPTPAHKGDDGAANFTLAKDDGGWKANINLQQGLELADIRFVVGHELDEISDITRKHPTGKPPRLMTQEQDPGATRSDNNRNKNVHSHDIAAAKEVAALYEDWRALVAANDPEAARRKDTLDKAIKANKFEVLDPSKIKALQEAGVPDAVRLFLEKRTAPVRLANVDPGTIPADLPAETQRIFEQAAALHIQITGKDNPNARFLGPEFAAVKWQEFLRNNGVEVDIAAVKVTKLGPPKPQADTADNDTLNRTPQPADTIAVKGKDLGDGKRGEVSHVDTDSAIGARAANLTGVSNAHVKTAFTELSTQPSSTYKVVKGAGSDEITIEVTMPDGVTKKTQSVKLAKPQNIDGQMSGYWVDGDEIHVWVSPKLPDDQVHRAFGAVMGRVVAKVQEAPGGATADPKLAAAIGQADALLRHLDVAKAADQAGPEPMPTGADPKKLVRERSEVAERNAKRESLQRIEAEIDLLIAQHPELIAQAPAELKVKLEARVKLGFEPGEVGKRKLPAAPAAEDTSPEAARRKSSVLPDAPQELQSYGAADRITVLELKVVFETIKEIDSRLALRDQLNTANVQAVKATDTTPAKPEVAIADGETLRRQDMVAKAQALMAKLQLGGTDPAYYQARLDELDAVIPGARKAIGDSVLARVDNRRRANQAHDDSQDYVRRATEKSQQIEQMLAGTTPTKPFVTERIVIGDGPTGLADIAALAKKGNLPKGDDGFIDPATLLVVGGPDLLAKMADSGPNMRWGQRAEVFDGAEQKHPIFRGGGELKTATEDHGDFTTVGQMHDAMNNSRDRIGVARANAKVVKVETQESNGTDWAMPGYPVRVIMVVNDKQIVVYAKATDVTTGIGSARLPDQSILSPADAEALTNNKQRTAAKQVMMNGEDAMTTRGDDGSIETAFKDQKVLVLGFGPTGAWAAIEARRRGASGVDWGGTSADLTQGGNSNENSIKRLRSLDRVQETLAPTSQVNITTDRIVKITPQGEGALVIYAKGKPPNVEFYPVRYDKVINSNQPSAETNTQTPSQPSAPKSGDIVDGIKLAPQVGTDAPVWATPGDTVRVMGPAATGIRGRGTEPQEIARRGNDIARSADSPGDPGAPRVMGPTGVSVELANGIDPKTGEVKPPTPTTE